MGNEEQSLGIVGTKVSRVAQVSTIFALCSDFPFYVIVLNDVNHIMIPTKKAFIYMKQSIMIWIAKCCSEKLHH